MARAKKILVGNLSVKVLDNWHERGWYVMFKRRFKADPKTNQPVPSHARAPPPAWSAIPAPFPSLHGRQEDGNDDDEHQADVDHRSVSDHQSPNPPRMPDDQRALLPSMYPSPPKAVMSRASVADASSRPQTAISQLYAPTNGHALQAPYAQTATPPQIQYAPAHSNQSSPSIPATYAYPGSGGSNGPAPYYTSPPSGYASTVNANSPAFETHTIQALTRLTQLTQTLLGTCTTLADLVRAQMEDSKVRTELLKRREERVAEGHDEGEMGRPQKASLAMELLSNPDVRDDIKGYAADYLKKLFQ